MTDLPSFAGPFDGTELFEVVAPGNAAEGINYSVTALTLTQFVIGLIATPTFITDGADIGDPFAVDPTMLRVLVNKTVGAATEIVLDPASTFQAPLLIKDLKGDADLNPITITFSGGDTMDGLTQVVINNPFGYMWFNPLAAGNWYDAAF